VYNLTQTTENDRSQGRICPPTTSTRKSLRRYVGATSHRWIVRQHTRRNEHCGTLQCRVSLEGAGQRACTVPTSTTNTVIRLELYHPILLQSAKNG